MSKSDPKSCPFCGGSAVIHTEKQYGVPSGDDGWLCSVICAECGASVKAWALVKSWAVETATEKWNRRTLL